MSTRIRYVAYSLVGISIALALVLAYPEVTRSRATARTGLSATDSQAGTGKQNAQSMILMAMPLPTPVGKPGVSSPLGDNTALARINSAAASHSGKASASSAAPGYDPSGTIDGDRKGLNGGKDGYWSSDKGTFPQWLEVDFKGSRTITEIDVFTIQDNFASPDDPKLTTEFTKFGLTDFDVEFWSAWSGVPPPGSVEGGFWITVPGGSRRGNKLVWNQFDLSASPITTTRIRVKCLGSADTYSRIAELEAWSK